MATACPLEACWLVADAHWMLGLPFRRVGIFANVLTAAGLLLMALGGAVGVNADSTRRATSPPGKTLPAAIAPTTSAAEGNER